MTRLTTEIHPSLTREIIDALHSKQLFTVSDFIKSDIQQIINTTRLTFKEVLEVRRFLLKSFSAAPVNAFDCYRATLKNAAIIPTEIESVDMLLSGGLYTGNIYELCGLPASGKTKFALTLVKNVASKFGQQLCFFDTKNDFTGHAIQNMLKDIPEDEAERVLSNIMVKRTYTRFELINSLYELKRSMKKDLKLRLIIIASLPAVRLNSNDPVDNNSFANNLANVLRYIAVEFHVAILIINLVVTWTHGDFKKQQEKMENVACGKYWSTVPNTRLRIEALEDGSKCTMSVIFSDSLIKTNGSADISFNE